MRYIFFREGEFFLELGKKLIILKGNGAHIRPREIRGKRPGPREDDIQLPDRSYLTH